MYGGQDHQGWLHFLCFSDWVLSKVTPEAKIWRLQHAQELCPAGLSTGSNVHSSIKKKKKFFSWAKGTQKCVGQRLAVNTYKFLSHPGGSDLLNSLCVAPARCLLWHIPVCPWKGGVYWGQSWGLVRAAVERRWDKKYSRVATVQFPENSVEKVSFPLEKNLRSPPRAEAATSTEPGWGNRGVPVLLGKAGKTKSNITIR